MTVIRTGSWLDQQQYAPPTWAVPGVIPDGCCVLAGHPKIGKSFLVLAIALAIADGGAVLGVDVAQRPVLYLALEDNERRLQKRARDILDGSPLPAEFHFITREHQKDALTVAQGWVKAYASRRPVVFVDTLEKIRPARSHNAYEDDYKIGGLLQTLEAPGGAVVAVHHSRKNSSEDFLEEVSGTLGLAGSVDTVIALKRARTRGEATLSVTGRDVEEMVYAVNFANGKWAANGMNLAEAAQRAAACNLGDGMRAVLELVNSRKITTSADVVEHLGQKEATARQYLKRLADDHNLIWRVGLG